MSPVPGVLFSREASWPLKGNRCLNRCRCVLADTSFWSVNPLPATPSSVQVHKFIVLYAKSLFIRLLYVLIQETFFFQLKIMIGPEIKTSYDIYRVHKEQGDRVAAWVTANIRTRTSFLTSPVSLLLGEFVLTQIWICDIIDDLAVSWICSDTAEPYRAAPLLIA